MPKGQGLALCLRMTIVEKVGYVDRYIHDIDRKILKKPALSINANTDLERREEKYYVRRVKTTPSFLI